MEGEKARETTAKRNKQERHTISANRVRDRETVEETRRAKRAMHGKDRRRARESETVGKKKRERQKKKK